MSRKPKGDQDEYVLDQGFGRGGICKASDRKQPKTDSERKPPKPTTSGKTKVSASEPEDND